MAAAPGSRLSAAPLSTTSLVFNQIKSSLHLWCCRRPGRLLSVPLCAQLSLRIIALKPRPRSCSNSLWVKRGTDSPAGDEARRRVAGFHALMKPCANPAVTFWDTKCLLLKFIVKFTSAQAALANREASFSMAISENMYTHLQWLHHKPPSDVTKSRKKHFLVGENPSHKLLLSPHTKKADISFSRTL